MKNGKKLISGAPLTMHELGKATDSLVTKEVVARPGSTVSEIADALRCSNGKVDGSVNRLARKKDIVVKHFLQRGTLVKKVYPKDYIDKPRDQIEIPKSMISRNGWKQNAFVYALSRSTIGLSPKKNEEWAKKSLLSDNIHIGKERSAFIVTLPDKFSSFYELENSETSLSTIDDIALVTIESTLPVALPMTYPEQNKRPLLTYSMEVDRELLGCVSQNEFFFYMHERKKRNFTLYSYFPYMDLVRNEGKIVTVSSYNVEPSKEDITLPLVSK